MRRGTRRDFVRTLAGTALLAARNAQADEMPQEPDEFAFGAVADVQYCDADPAGTRHYRASAGKLSSCVDAFNQMELAFVVQLGDLIDRDFQSFDEILPIFNRIRSCRFHVLGNHDFSVAQEKIDEVPGPCRYYAWCVNGWRLVVLDGNDLSFVARHKGSCEYEQAQRLYDSLKMQNAPNAQTWNGGIGTTQLGWLECQLSQADRVGQRVMVFCHYPVYPVNAHNLWNDRDVIRILEAHPCVKAYMNGHNHAGKHAHRCGIHYLTFPGMVETSDTTAYAVVRLHKDDLAIVGYGRTPSRRLKLRS